MVRAVAMSAASALCLIWTAGCASSNEQAPKPAAMAAAAPQANTAADTVAAANNLPATLQGEIRRAEKLRQDGDYDEAIRALAQIMLVAPDDARVVGAYGKTLEQQGHSQEALAFLKRAVELDPGDWRLYSALGIAYDQLDDHKSARTAYERALTLRPLEPSVLNNYAVSRMLAGDYPGAQRLFAEASARGVSNPKLELNLQKLAALEPAAPSTAPDEAGGTERPKNQTIATDDLAPVSVPAAKLSSTAKSAVSARVATAAPKSLGPQVVMERVPVDPLAGPVKRAKHVGEKLAKASPAHPAAPPKPMPPTPSLRTAADSN